MESVRLVIWDLDETFWKGTLSEGGIEEYIGANHDLIIELAKRGIISSICSKNDFDTIKATLTERGLWEYFVFPSINWEPKGPRLAKQVELFQLRPETVLFIDDNASNRGEAERFVKGLQIADETVIPSIHGDPRFKGKDDSQLTRLAQYKVLEQKNADWQSAGSDPRAFLLDSHIVVRIEHDLAAHEDRAIELINRTNQLNFTKLRLSEEPEEARREFRKQIARFDVQGGIVSVRDRYGDYGAVGFYLLRSDNRGSRLTHFCFSCRTLNMGIEAYIYQKLGSPRLDVVGDVLTDLFNHPPVDWINVSAAIDNSKAGAPLPIVARGGCDLSAVTHYFGSSSATVQTELVTVRNGIDIRFDHSLMAHYCIFPPSERVMEELSHLGYRRDDFRTKLTTPGSRIRMLGLWGDANFPLYRHKILGFDTVFAIVGVAWNSNLVLANPDHVAPYLATEEAKAAFFHLRENYDCIGIMSPDRTADHIEAVVETLPAGEALFVPLANTNPYHLTGWEDAAARNRTFNDTVMAVSKKFPSMVLIDVERLLERDQDVIDLYHFDRMVYYRIYQEISAIIASAGERKQQLAYA